MKSTPAMRDRIRELSNGERDDYDRAVLCVLDDLEALIAAIPQWQPIDTAPKDKCIMLCVAGFEPAAGRWWPIDGCWTSFDWEGHFETDQETSIFVNSTHYEPTHWMPLPPTSKVES